MGKQFYNFGDKIFRDALWEEYIIPVANWFMREPTSAYLLPQSSGSIWECSLAIDFLLKVADNKNLSAEFYKNIHLRCCTTVMWMISQLKEEDKGYSWDSAQWDTSVALRTIVQSRDKLDSISERDSKKIDKAAIDVCIWLMNRVKAWERVAYLAGPPDLAQVLKTLMFMQHRYPEDYKNAEIQTGFAEFESINEAARFLIALARPIKSVELNEIEQPGSNNLICWVDAFNTGEVLQALSSYLKWSEQENQNVITKDILAEYISKGLRYIEITQHEGTWNSVADTCGTLWCYMVVVREIPTFDYEDHVVFKTLRWMCDSNQSLDDGSFLHSSYVTVFYALSLYEAYLSWPLGFKSTNEVYDVALWLAPNTSSEERTKRLDLELKISDSEDKIKLLLVSGIERKIRNYTLITILISAALLIITLQLSKSIEFIKFVFELKNQLMFFSIISSWITITTICVTAFRNIVKKKLFRKYSIKLTNENIE